MHDSGKVLQINLKFIIIKFKNIIKYVIKRTNSHGGKSPFSSDG